MRVLLIVLIGEFLFGCAKNPSNGNTNGFDCEANKSETHQLCIQGTDDAKGTATGIVYYVINQSGDKVFEGIVDSGYVRWLDDNAIEIYQTPGMVSTELSKDDITKVYVLTKDELISKTEYKDQK